MLFKKNLDFTYIQKSNIFLLDPNYRIIFFLNVVRFEWFFNMYLFMTLILVVWIVKSMILYIFVTTEIAVVIEHIVTVYIFMETNKMLWKKNLNSMNLMSLSILSASKKVGRIFSYSLYVQPMFSRLLKHKKIIFNIFVHGIVVG